MEVTNMRDASVLTENETDKIRSMVQSMSAAEIDVVIDSIPVERIMNHLGEKVVRLENTVRQMQSIIAKSDKNIF